MQLVGCACARAGSYTVVFNCLPSRAKAAGMTWDSDSPRGCLHAYAYLQLAPLNFEMFEYESVNFGRLSLHIFDRLAAMANICISAAQQFDMSLRSSSWGAHYNLMIGRVHVTLWHMTTQHASVLMKATYAPTALFAAFNSLLVAIAAVKLCSPSSPFVRTRMWAKVARGTGLVHCRIIGTKVCSAQESIDRQIITGGCNLVCDTDDKLALLTHVEIASDHTQ